MKKTPAKIKRPLWVVGLNIALALTVGTTQAFADTPITNQTQLEAIGTVLAGNYVVTQSFSVIAPIAGDRNSYVNGTFTGTFDGGGYTISGLAKPLFDGLSGDVSNLNLASTAGVTGNGALANTQYSSSTIDNVSFVGDVTSNDNNVGGLVGLSNGSISGSSATGNVTGEVYVGGLVGQKNYGPITNSYAEGTVTGTYSVGGLVGEALGGINSSYAISGVVGGSERTGGLAGHANYVPITNSYAEGAVTGSWDVGGLVGLLFAGISNSYSGSTVTGVARVGGLAGHANYVPITNSYAEGSIDGNFLVGGLVGLSYTEIINSHANGDVTGGSYVGEISGQQEYVPITNSYATGRVVENNIVERVADTVILPNIPLEVLNYNLNAPVFAQSEGINGDLPYLISNSPVDAAGADTADTADTAANPTFSLESFYSQAAKSLDNVLTSLGFKSNLSSNTNLGFQALEQNQSKLPAAIQLFEVSEYQNSSILLNKEDGLQLSISSYYKEPVEIWTQGLDGEYLYLGLVEFDKDGKAILPSLKFDTAGTHQLLVIKAADKLVEKPNLEAKVGQITINVF